MNTGRIVAAAAAFAGLSNACLQVQLVVQRSVAPGTAAGKRTRPIVAWRRIAGGRSPFNPARREALASTRDGAAGPTRSGGDCWRSWIASRRFAHGQHGRQSQGHQNPDDGNHDQQFDQRESPQRRIAVRSSGHAPDLLHPVGTGQSLPMGASCASTASLLGGGRQLQATDPSARNSVLPRSKQFACPHAACVECESSVCPSQSADHERLAGLLTSRAIPTKPSRRDRHRSDDNGFQKRSDITPGYSGGAVPDSHRVPLSSNSRIYSRLTTNLTMRAESNRRRIAVHPPFVAMRAQRTVRKRNDDRQGRTRPRSTAVRRPAAAALHGPASLSGADPISPGSRPVPGCGWAAAACGRPWPRSAESVRGSP